MNRSWKLAASAIASVAVIGGVFYSFAKPDVTASPAADTAVSKTLKKNGFFDVHDVPSASAPPSLEASAVSANDSRPAPQINERDAFIAKYGDQWGNDLRPLMQGLVGIDSDVDTALNEATAKTSNVAPPNRLDPCEISSPLVPDAAGQVPVTNYKGSVCNAQALRNALSAEVAAAAEQAGLDDKTPGTYVVSTFTINVPQRDGTAKDINIRCNLDRRPGTTTRCSLGDGPG